MSPQVKQKKNRTKNLKEINLMLRTNNKLIIMFSNNNLVVFKRLYKLFYNLGNYFL